MKTKVIYFILTAILIISVLSAIAIYATVADTKTEEVPTDVKIEKIVSRDIEKTKSVKLGNGETIELNYNKTRNLSLNQFTDDYTDKNNNTFEFNEKGKLSGFVVNDVVCSQAKTDEALFAVGNGNVVSESDVINVAKEHLSKMFGE
ncbi:MAG: hypothetical protein IKM46_05230 [Clostridia bacterium]|nr:hypothetical protein [Clostridia bacterium]